MSEALAVEVKDHIDVMSMHPGLVSSNMCTLPAGGPCATTKDVVTACLKNLGHDSVSVGVWRHEWDMLNVLRYRMGPRDLWADYFTALEAKEKAQKEN